LTTDQFLALADALNSFLSTPDHQQGGDCDKSFN
jgi:hypothetical protein